MKHLLYLLIFTLGCPQTFACNKDRKMNISTPDTMKLKITIGSNTATAILYDNPTSRDFATLLPLTVEFADYANIEKVFTPPKKLSTQAAPKGFDPSAGDLTLYAPWGNIALFYKDFSYANGLISLGRITEGLEYFTVDGTINATIELDH